MRQRRAKLYRKMLQQYQLQFGFREPFQLLIDDTFALALTRFKIDTPLSQFSNVLQTKKVKPLITQCCMQALYSLGKEHQPTVGVAKEWERRLCNHREAIDPQECVKQCVGTENKHRYVVASEQGELRRDLRLNVVGVPMMHFTQSVIVLEPMSELTKSKIEEKEDTKLSLPASEAGLLRNQPSVEVDIVGAKEEGGEGEEEGKEGSLRRRKRKAPNPLSVRKAKNPKLTIEEKLEKEQEVKKQKQRMAARARLEANKLKDGEASSDGGRRKRKRPGNKSDTNQAAVTEAPPKKEIEKSSEPVTSSANVKSGSTRRKRRTRSSSANAGASANDAAAETSA